MELIHLSCAMEETAGLSVNNRGSRDRVQDPILLSEPGEPGEGKLSKSHVSLLINGDKIATRLTELFKV